jgi:heptosyltransferase II
MVMAQSLFIALKQLHPHCEIDVLAPTWSGALLDHMPEINNLIEMTVGHGELGLGKRRALARSLKQTGYDQAIVLPNSFKSALIPWLAGIPLRTGWRGEARGWLLNDCRVLDKKAYPLMVERFVALANTEHADLPDPLPRPALSVSSERRESVMNKFSLDTTKPVLVLCPGAEFGEAKKWPAQSYAVVAKNWLKNAGQVWILGSGNDSQDAFRLKSTLPFELADCCHDLTGKTSLGEVIDLMACVVQVVSNDSGLMHIAAALAKPLVVIYGSTSPTFTPPLSEKVGIVSLNLDCSPCFKRTCPLGHTNCLKQLVPDMVIHAMEELKTS